MRTERIPLTKNRRLVGLRGAELQHNSTQRICVTFSHPDYTVGPGLSPDRARLKANLRAWWFGSQLPTPIPPVGNYLAKSEIHPAPKVAFIQLHTLYLIVTNMSNQAVPGVCPEV